jgi:hypothetical protein
MANLSDLPWEIRDMIWNLVPRDDHPEVHIFGHYDENKKGMAEGRSMMHGSHFSGVLSEPPPHRYFDSLDKDRGNENMSTYLIDGAMWTTCKHSRLIIKKHFSQYKWPDDRLFPFRTDYWPSWSLEYPYQAVFQVPSTGYFEGGPPHYLTVFPRRDLFVFQPDKLGGIDWYWVASSPTRAGTRPPFRRLQHIAIEFNPDWWESVKPWADTSIPDRSPSIDFVRQFREWTVQEECDRFWSDRIMIPNVHSRSTVHGVRVRSRTGHCKIGLLGWEAL